MVLATRLLRHLRRRRLFPPVPPPFHRSNPHQNHSPFSYSDHATHSSTSSNPKIQSFYAKIPSRSFSWHAWTGGTSDDIGGSASGSGAGGDSLIGNSKEGLEFSPADGSETGAGISSLGSDGSGMMEETVEESVWYYPVLSVITLLDGYHDLTGLPWWLIISTSTLALRVSLLPVLILQLKKAGEIAKLFPKLPPPFPPPLSGRSFQDHFLLFQKKRRELGCPSFLWNFAFFTVQVPSFLLWMTSIRRMCLDSHPGLDSGGTLWFQNLTDFPHGILGPIFPILIAGLHYINVQISFQTFKFENYRGILGLLVKYYKLYLDILAIPLLLIGFHIPQQLSFRNPYIRMKLGLPEQKVQMRDKISSENVLHEKSGLLEHAISAETSSPEKLLDLALDNLAAGQQDKALPLLRMATDKNPELVRAWIAMGQILCSKGLFLEAAEHFERAISKIQEEEDALRVLAYFGAGVSHIWQGDKSMGIEHLKRLAELKEPDGPMDKACYYRGLVMLGSTLFQEGEKSEASKYLRVAAAYDPAVDRYVKECEEA
ncbi:ALBINO3-like protein 2, chloroplastic isoform X2 [Phoenix dactylifera]|uniref:ALBINO3-like protein 2, chloroplastic isoform X2 n=1 Tax=Phoenix dactylifera TaxID=42345 RepID=A0A8B8ZWV4_PHODC|nr:ALBINO3-like protein 2, chloroplastic isoform X2 [Phoenix dactylifera]